jgi:hypothetical protein
MGERSGMKIKRLPRSSVWFILDQIFDEYHEDLEAWIDEYLADDHNSQSDVDGSLDRCKSSLKLSGEL